MMHDVSILTNDSTWHNFNDIHKPEATVGVLA